MKNKSIEERLAEAQAAKLKTVKKIIPKKEETVDLTNNSVAKMISDYVNAGNTFSLEDAIPPVENTGTLSKKEKGARGNYSSTNPLDFRISYDSEFFGVADAHIDSGAPVSVPEEQEGTDTKTKERLGIFQQIRHKEYRPYNPFDDSFIYNDPSKHWRTEGDTDIEKKEPEVVPDEEAIVNIRELADKYTAMEMSTKYEDFTIEKYTDEYNEILDKHYSIISSFKRSKNV